MEKFGKLLKHDDESLCYMATEVQQVQRIISKEITFGDRDYVGTNYPYTNAIVIMVRIWLTMVNRILTNNERYVSFSFKYAFDKITLLKKDLYLCTSAL